MLAGCEVLHRREALWDRCCPRLRTNETNIDRTSHWIESSHAVLPATMVSLNGLL